MIDECRHCTVRGDLTKCQSTECVHHNSWMVRELLKERDTLLESMESQRKVFWQDNNIHAERAYKAECEVAKLRKELLVSCLVNELRGSSTEVPTTEGYFCFGTPKYKLGDKVRFKFGKPYHTSALWSQVFIIRIILRTKQPNGFMRHKYKGESADGAYSREFYEDDVELVSCKAEHVAKEKN